MKDQLTQADYRLNPDINREGCLFRSLLAIAEYVAAKPLTAVQILTIWRTCIDTKALKTRAGKTGYFVENPDAVIGYGWAALGLSGRAVRQIGSRAMHLSAEGQAWGKTEGTRYTVLKGATALGNSHFRLGDHRGVEIFDPRPQTPIKHEERVDYYG